MSTTRLRALTSLPLVRDVPPGDWHRRAVCRDHPDPRLWDWSVDDGGPGSERADARSRRHDTAITLCRGCPVQAECRADTMPRRDEGVRAAQVLPPLEKQRKGDGTPGRPPEPIEHGTDAGYRAHIRRGQPVPPDDPCGCLAGQTAARQARGYGDPVECPLCGTVTRRDGALRHAQVVHRQAS